MAKKRRNKRGTSLPKSEVWIVLAFVLSFLAWGMTRCNFGIKDYFASKQAEIVENKDSLANASNSMDGTSTDPRRETIHVTELYITIDSFNFRTTPKLDGAVIKKLRMSEKVVYLNQVTDFSQKIFVNQNWEDEPWVKVRTIEGDEGWVYGAGVSYYDEGHKQSIDGN